METISFCTFATFRPSDAACETLTVGRFRGFAMSKKRGETADRILVAARDVVRTAGPDRLTFDAIAEKVGISKQAVLYWFPNKARLIEALVRPALEAESAAGRTRAGGRHHPAVMTASGRSCGCRSGSAA